MKEIELLAPAGSFEKAKIAFLYGADAVYCGTSSLSLRTRAEMKDDDLLIITADHGNDPTHTGTDHTREMVPILYYSKSFDGCGLLPLSQTFANVGATIADNFNVDMPEYGESMLNYIK